MLYRNILFPLKIYKKVLDNRLIKVILKSILRYKSKADSIITLVIYG
jgi:hypothetical protein